VFDLTVAPAAIIILFHSNITIGENPLRTKIQCAPLVTLHKNVRGNVRRKNVRINVKRKCLASGCVGLS